MEGFPEHNVFKQPVMQTSVGPATLLSVHVHEV